MYSSNCKCSMILSSIKEIGLGSPIKGHPSRKKDKCDERDKRDGSIYCLFSILGIEPSLL